MTVYLIYSKLPFIFGGHILYPEPKETACCGDRDPHNMDMFFHYSLFLCFSIPLFV
jgi:hypothetical protein